MISCIVQARMGSSRLPGKVLKKIDEKNTILDYVINQLQVCNKIEKIIVATTNLQEDNIICTHLDSQQIEYYRGSSNDVLDRYFQCAKKFSMDIIVRITSDNPLIDPNIVDEIINEYENKKCDFATNTIHRTFPHGTEVEVFSFDVLKKAQENAKKPSEREHVTTYIRDPQNKFRLVNVENHENISKIRYTVDRTEDLEFVKEIVKNIHARPILLKHILDLHKNKPEIFKINENIKHDGYITSLKKDEQYLKSQHGKDS